MREDDRVKRRRGVDDIIEGVAERTADILARMQEEEREEKAREEKIVEGHEDGGRDLDTTNEYNDFEFVRVPGQQNHGKIISRNGNVCFYRQRMLEWELEENWELFFHYELHCELFNKVKELYNYLNGF